MTVPTVERGLWLVAFCSMLIAGLQALDQVDIGLVHQLQELARIGRQALDIAALAPRRRACRRPGLDLPDPDRPVITTSACLGMSRSMFLRLCVRAPRSAWAGARRRAVGAFAVGAVTAASVGRRGGVFSRGGRGERARTTRHDRGPPAMVQLRACRRDGARRLCYTKIHVFIPHDFDLAGLAAQGLPGGWPAQSHGCTHPRPRGGLPALSCARTGARLE